MPNLISSTSDSFLENILSDIDNVSSIILPNGNVFVTYRDNDNKYYGTYVILNSNGDIIKEPIVFSNQPTYSITTTLLANDAVNNDHILIAYRSNGYGIYTILDKDGNIIKDNTVFNTGITTFISTTALSNGNVLIAYQSIGNNIYGTYVILDNNGNIVKEPTIFINSGTAFISSTILTNSSTGDDHVLIAYRNDDNGYGYYIILDSDGNVVKEPTVFTTTTVYLISTTTLSNGNVHIAYCDADNSYYGTYVIVDDNGNIVKEHISVY